jgi:hypothetical protein
VGPQASRGAEPWLPALPAPPQRAHLQLSDLAGY